MRAQPPESLSEFEPEGRHATELATPEAETREFMDDHDADRPPTIGIAGSLLDVVGAASPADTPQVPLSRIESRQARRRSSHLKRAVRSAGPAAHAISTAAARAWCGAIAHASAASRRMRAHTVATAHATRRVAAQGWAKAASAANAPAHAWGQMWSRMRAHVKVPTTSRTALEVFEFDGTVIAMSLAVAVLAYGGFQSRSRPALPVSAAPVAPVAPLTARAAEAVETLAPPIIEPAAVPAVPPAVATDASVVTRPAARPALNATTLNAIWRRQDSRSLQQAFTGLRSQTLAFHRCGMRVTDTDRAVATCEGASRAKWTIDFRRSAGRWQIDRVTTR